MSSRKKLLATTVIAIAAVCPAVAAPDYQTPAPVAYLQDLSSGAILYSKDADRRMPPASMAKMMTVYVAFELIKSGELKLTQKNAGPPGNVARVAQPGVDHVPRRRRGADRGRSAEGHRYVVG